MSKKYDLSNPPSHPDKDFKEYVRRAFTNNEISKDEFYEANSNYLTKCYLSHDNPRGQSGHGGDEYSYMFRHLPIIVDYEHYPRRDRFNVLPLRGLFLFDKAVLTFMSRYYSSKMK